MLAWERTSASAVHGGIATGNPPECNLCRKDPYLRYPITVSRCSILTLEATAPLRSRLCRCLVLFILWSILRNVQVKKTQDTNKTQDSRLTSFWFHYLKYCHQGRTEANHSDADKLRYRQAVNFKTIVVAQKLDKKSCDAVKNKHQSKG